MKRYNKIAYIGVIIIISLLFFGIYKIYKKNNSNEDIKNKALAEVKKIEGEFVDIFNKLNNVNFDNYKVSASEMENLQNKNKSSSESNSSEGESKSKSTSTSEDSSQKSQNETEDNTKNQQYKLEKIGILTKDEEINWKEIKNKVETLYTSLYLATLDLYQTTNNQEDIVNFNKEYDNLTKAVKDEDKEKSLKELSNLYNYMPKFVENCTDKEREKIIINTKNYIFKAYSILDTEEWSNISDNINRAIEQFSKLVNSKETGNRYNINKVYIIINELQNAVNLKDKEIFLIKYKKLLEEIQNI